MSLDGATGIDLRGKVALVTGAGSGLGAATARAFAREGCAVACLDIQAGAAAGVARQIATADVDALPLGCDVGDAAAAEHAVADVVDRLGRLDVLVNCAAVDHTLAVEEMSVSQWDQVIGVNLRGPFLFSRLAFPVMKRQGGGHIVNIAS